MTTTTTFTITPEERNTLLARDDGKQLGLGGVPVFQSMRETYEREGFVLVRGLLGEELLKRMCRAGEALTDAASPGNRFTSLDFGAIFNFQDDDGTANGDAFRETALDSAIPAFIAKVLLGTEDKGESLRMLKDAFMAKGKEEKYCGWHVDDIGFWPTDSSSTGVNGWLALDDIPAKYGGGLAISPRSHTAEWRKKAYETIGSTPLLPPEGITLDSISGSFMQTCEMASLDPNLNERIESTKLVLDYQAGDCLFCHRWLFHRSVSLNDEGLKYYGDNMPLKRYTIRYERGTAKLMNGISLEPAILLNPENAGKTLDDVCQLDGPFYPQWCPSLGQSEDQKSKMKSLAQEKFPHVQEKKVQVMNEISAAMKSVATKYK